MKTKKIMKLLFARHKSMLSCILVIAMLLTNIPLSAIYASAASSDTMYIASTGNIDEHSYTAEAGISAIEVGYPYESDIISGPSEVTLTGFSKLIINQPTSDTVFKSINKLTVDINFDRKNYDIKETQSGGYYLYSCKCYITRQINVTGNGTVTVSGNILAGCDNGVYYLAYDWDDNRRLDSYEEKNYTTTNPITVLNVSYCSHLTILSGEWNEINVEDGTDTIQEGGKIGTFTVTGILREYEGNASSGGATGGSTLFDWTVRAPVRFTQNGGRADNLTTNRIDAKYSYSSHYPEEQNGLHPIYFYLNAPAYNGLSPVGQAIINTNYSSTICLGANFPNAYADTGDTPVLLGGKKTAVDARLYSFNTSTEKINFTGDDDQAYVLLPEGFELANVGIDNFKAQQKTGLYTFNYTPIFSNPLTYMSEIDNDRVKNQTKLTSYEGGSAFNFLDQIGFNGPLFRNEEILGSSAYCEYLSITDKTVDAGIYYAAYSDWSIANFATPSFFYFEVAPAEVTITVNKNVSRKVGEMNLWDSDYYTATLSDGTDVTGKLPDKYLLTYLGKDQVGSGLDISLTQSISCDGNYHYTLVNGNERLTIQNISESTGGTVPYSAVASIVSENGAGEDGWYCDKVQLRAPDGYLISYKKDGDFTKSVVYSGSSDAPQTVSYYLKLNNGGNIVSALKTISVKLCNIDNVATINLNGSVSGTGTSRTATLNITRNELLFYQYGIWKLYAMVADSMPSYADVVNDANLVYTHNVNPESVSATFNNLGAGRTYSIYYVTISSSGVRSEVAEVNGSSFTTEKITPTVTTLPTSSAVVGTKLGAVKITGGVVTGSNGETLTGSWAWTNSADYEKKLTIGATASYSATFTPDSASYAAVTANIIPTIAYAAPVNVSGVYQIKTVNDLMWFSALVNGNTVLTGGVAQNKSANALLMADLSLDNTFTRIGTAANPYSGTFDGSKHTITVKYTGVNCDRCGGVFDYLGSSTIKNMTVNGTINAASHCVGGVIGYGCTNGEAVTLENIISNVAITTTFSGDASSGGIIAVSHGIINMTDCAFTGSVTATAGTNCSGMIGYSWQGATYTNCYMAGTMSLYSDTGSATFSRGAKAANCINSYYLNSYGAEQGARKSAVQFASGEVAYLLNGGKTDGTQLWYQTVGEGTPLFSGKTVYKYTTGYSNSSLPEKIAIAETNGSFAAIESPYDITATLIFAAYDKIGKLISLDMQNNKSISAGSNTYMPTERFSTDGANKIKVMLWESVENIKPICEAVDVDLK